MAIRVNPKLINDLERYGAEDVKNCYHCGNCSAVCNHSDQVFLFPRRPMRFLQMGLERKLEDSLDPWLCYYCGQCSTQCPRGAEPGETMMSLRRWLTSRYDITGISRLFYRSWKAELVAIIFTAVLTAAGWLMYGFRHGRLDIYDGAGAFMPTPLVHIFDWSMAGVLTALLAVNAVRMWWFAIGRDKNLRVPLGSYLKHILLLPFHFATQARYRRCDSKRPWLIHVLLMASYATMLVLIMFFLRRMQQGPAIDWSVHAFGYLASVGLVGTTIYALRGRVRKTEPHYRHSHESDWIFLILLLIVTSTGIAQHTLHRAGLNVEANLAYVVHLMGVVPMLVLEVPFSKWSHMIYRPLAMYLAQVHRDAVAEAANASGQFTEQANQVAV